MKKSDLDESLFNRSIRILQETLLFAYIFWKKVCLHISKASSEKVIVTKSEKMKENTWMGCMREFFP